LYIRYYLFKFPRDNTIYIEDDPVKELRNDDKLTIYENSVESEFIGKNLNELRLNRCFYSRAFHCTAPKDMQIEIYLLPPEETTFLYPNTHLFRLNQTSEINVLEPDFKIHPLFKKCQYVDVPLVGGQFIVIPRGWWFYTDSPKKLLEMRF
tara:strand:+ start:902 stop:1354 length:453 start_codon:yes stop_codon:yes gene_type:complete